jgi:hypothetical protein
MRIIRSVIMKDILLTGWNGAPLVVWLMAGILMALFIVLLLVVLVQRIHISWTRGKNGSLKITTERTIRKR